VVAGAPPAALGRAAAPRTAPGGAPLSPPLPSVATALDSRCQVCSRSGAESSRRWVPGTLRTSCELLILVNQPAKPVAWSDVADLGCGAAAACRLIDDQDAVEDFAADAGLPAVTIRSIGRGGADQRP